MTAGDVRYGRRGGRWASPPPDAAKVAEWERQRDALAAAAARAREATQLDLFADDTQGV